MHLAFLCPVCEKQTQTEFTGQENCLKCAHCEWSRPVSPDFFDDGIPNRCLACGCDDLWKQRDFPQKLGLAIVGTQILLSTLAWAWMYPLLCYGILLAFLLLDYVLYSLMPDVLVCYRCRARYRFAKLPESVPAFDLETAERYRQEAMRLEASSKNQPAGS